MTVGLWFDWTGAGFGTGANDDCTTLLRSITYQRGGTAELTGASQAGSCTIRLRNIDGLFDPDNTSGALYGLLRDGVRVWFGANEDGSISGAGTVRGRFAGRVTDISPIPQAGAGTSTPEVEIVCEDALGWYGRTPVSLSVAATVPDYIPPLPSATPTLLQWATGSSGTSATLSAGATAGSLLLAVAERNDNQGDPGTPVTSGWTALGSSQVTAHPVYGGQARLCYKFAAGGETTVTFGAVCGIIIAEISGPFAGYLAGGATSSSYNLGTAVSQASVATGYRSLVVGGVATRLDEVDSPIGTITPGAGTTLVPPNPNLLPTALSYHDAPALLFGLDATGTGATLTGTLAGLSQDGYYWGMQIGTFRL